MNKASGAPWAILRFFQFASAVLVMSLLAYSLNSYNFFGSKRANFGLSVGVIGTFYIICVIILVAIIPKLVMVGPYLVAECIMCLLWLCGFIVSADVFGKHSCGSFFITTSYNPKYGSFLDFEEANGRVNPFTNQYSSSSNKNACRSAKTSVAFSGLSFILFVISCVALGVNVVMPIVKSFGGSGLWKTGSVLGTRLHRWSGLGLTDSVLNNPSQQPPYGPTDLEQHEAAAMAGTTGGVTAPVVPDQRTISSEESAKSESPTNAEPKLFTQADRTAGMT